MPMLLKRILPHTGIFPVLFLLFSTSLNSQSFDPLDDWLEQNASEMGGRALLLIYKDGNIIYSKAVNELTPRQKIAGRMIARRQGKEANIRDFTSVSRQPIASCSKWLSAALVMTFVDEGKLKLSDTVGKFLPILTQNGKGNITISQCLSHTTGIKAEALGGSLQDMKNIKTMDEAIAKIAAFPMEGKPGTVFHYSNVGLQIAGAILEKISGKSFEILFAGRIAKPLHMKNTDFGKGPVALPAGGAYSTPEDYLNFLVMILNKGSFNGHRILSEKTVMEMQVNRITPEVERTYSPPEAGSFGYGLGEWVMKTSLTKNLTVSVSSPGLFGSFPWVDNEKKYCAFLMNYSLKNKGRHERYQQLIRLVEEAIIGDKAKTKSTLR